jgi:hypothetical protein
MLQVKLSNAKMAKIKEAMAKQVGAKPPLTNTDTGISMNTEDGVFTLQADLDTLVKYLKDKVEAQGELAISDKGNIACPLRSDEGEAIQIEHDGLNIKLIGNFLVNVLK